MLRFKRMVQRITMEAVNLCSCIFQILFGCVAQYTIMPAFGVIVSKSLGLPPSVSVGLILLACCPGGTASNVVRMTLSLLSLLS